MFTGKQKQALEYIQSLDENTLLQVTIIKEKKARSLRQNATFYKLFTEIGKHLGYTKDEMHDTLLGGVFGTYDIEIGPIKKQMLNKPETSKLSKEEGVFFIDAILEFCKKHNIPVEITSRELQSLYNTYN